MGRPNREQVQGGTRGNKGVGHCNTKVCTESGQGCTHVMGVARGATGGGGLAT